MKIDPVTRFGSALRRPAVIRSGFLLAAGMAFATYIGYKYSIFSPATSASSQQKIIDLDEGLALVALFCAGLLVLSWRLILARQREVARRIVAEYRVRKLAHQDPLTGLPNRRQFERQLTAAMAAPPRINAAHAMFLLNLNSFKRVNDVHGHAAGDEVLINVAARLQRAAREGDLVARLGGDEFVILARQLASAEEATTIARRVIKEFDQPILIGKANHKIGIAIGKVLIPQDCQNKGEIMRKVDIALSRAKARGGSASCFFVPAMDALIHERDLIERELRVAISADAVRPYFQPLIDLATSQVVGFETLARWSHPTLGNVPPSRFIPIAESCGLIDALTDQLLRHAANDACHWPDDFTLSFNISPVQLKDETLAVRILSIIKEEGLSPHRLEIEITESALVHDMEGAQRVLGTLRQAGVCVALDDFGTGYSSLYHLRNFKVDKIKIDRSFIESMQSEPEAMAIVRGLMGLGHGLGLTVTAEGVELPAQALALSAQGCDQAQGYLYGRAMSAADAIDFIAARSTGAPEALARTA